MTSTSHPEGETAETDPADSDIPDYTVSLADTPALVHPDVDVSLTVEVARLSASFLDDGLVDVDAGRPPTSLADAIEAEVENAGYAIASYESIETPIVDDRDELVDVRVELRVRALEGETETTGDGED